VFFLIDILAGLLHVLMQIFAFRGGEFAVGFVSAFFGTDGLLFLTKLGGLGFGELTGADALSDAILLGMLPGVHHGIVRRRPGRARTEIAIVTFPMDIAADAAAVLMQITALGGRQFAVAFEGAFFGAQGFFFRLKFAGFFLRQLTGAGALLDALLLGALSGVQVGAARRVSRQGGGDHGHAGQSG
jgi:hypothetical protein